MVVIDSEAEVSALQHSRDRAETALPDDYYVQAFKVVLDTVMAGSADLLRPAELEWVDRFAGLSDGARRLYVRLIQRRATTFRLGRLTYEDIPDIAGAAAELVRADLANDQAPDTMEALVSAFTLAELDALLPLAGPRARRRAQRVARLVKDHKAEDRDALATADHWLSIHGYEHFVVFRLCFFGNLRQDLSEFVTTALGNNRYVEVPQSANSRYFQSRSQLDAHLRYYECDFLFEQALPQDLDTLRQHVDALPQHREGDQLLARRLDRLGIAMACAFERLGDDAEAEKLYLNCHHAPARERRVRLLQRNDRHDEARTLLTMMHEAPACEAERDFAARHLNPRQRESKAFRPRSTTLVLPETDTRVESAAARYFARRGSCHWVENRLFSTVLGLWIWDIVFMPVRGAFFNPFQSAPADFRERGFRRARADALKQRFAELDDATAFEQRVRSTLRQQIGISNPLVSWGLADSPVLDSALERIPRLAFGAVFDRMLDDPGEHTTGFPDLVHFPEEGGYELIEIKGPGDALQANQRRWFRYFDEHGLPARVVKLRWAAKT